ncbi:hypothetical protein L6Q96_08920 [Candidatus Binatia bacterium]|nr:hypothetical protein [Candidatus Binatia bacterium]
MPRTRTAAMTLAGIALAVLINSATFAGIVDTPLPMLVAGKNTLHVYSVSGVNGGGGYALGTYFSCTSTDAATIQVGVEVFAPFGGAPINDGVATSLAVVPGQTVLFGTMSAAGIILNSDLGGGFGNAGSARIIATSKKLVCSAFLADRFSTPPASMVHLTIVKKATQKGE